jgi:hypothetical protein
MGPDLIFKAEIRDLIISNIPTRAGIGSIRSGIEIGGIWLNVAGEKLCERTDSVCSAHSFSGL